jgi:hypothetical protein
MKREQLQVPPLLKVTSSTRRATPDRYAEFVRLLALLLDKPNTPDDGRRP